jgi:hypothetical protein
MAGVVPIQDTPARPKIRHPLAAFGLVFPTLGIDYLLWSDPDVAGARYAWLATTGFSMARTAPNSERAPRSCSKPGRADAMNDSRTPSRGEVPKTVGRLSRMESASLE